MVKVSVDKAKCIGCGACVSMCPDVFEMGDDGKSHVKDSKACDKSDCEAAKNACPVGAIEIS